MSSLSRKMHALPCSVSKRKVIVDNSFELQKKLATEAEVEWLRSQITSRLEGNTFDESLSGAPWRVLAIGESTHGTREHMQTRGAYVRKIVAEQGCRRILLEASEAAVVDLDDSLQRGAPAGTLAAALSGLQFWTWHVQEALEIFTWIRAHNAVVQPHESVHVYGIDPQLPGSAVERLRSAAGDAVRIPRWLTQRRGKISCFLRRVQIWDSEVLSRADDEKSPMRRAGDMQILRRGIRYLTGIRSLRGGLRVMEFRDGMMAERVLELSGELGGPCLLFAHNAHIGFDAHEGMPRTMGWHLRRQLGSQYVAVAQFFGAGTFLSRSLITGKLFREPKKWSVKPERRLPLVENYLGAAMDNPGFLELRACVDAPETQWLREQRACRAYGAALMPLLYRGTASEIRLGATFDGLTYFPEATATTFMPRSR